MTTVATTKRRFEAQGRDVLNTTTGQWALFGDDETARIAATLMNEDQGHAADYIWGTRNAA
jgi:hypothetical protein